VIKVPCVLILDSAWEADRLDSAQSEFGLAKVLRDGCCKKIPPDSFNNEPCLRYFRISVSSMQICDKAGLGRQMTAKKGSVDGILNIMTRSGVSKLNVF